jgi:hypothetical protein
MKRSKFTEEQIAYALRQVESGSPAALIRARRWSGSRSVDHRPPGISQGFHQSRLFNALCLRTSRQLAAPPRRLRRRLPPHSFRRLTRYRLSAPLERRPVPQSSESQSFKVRHNAHQL